MIDTRPDFRAAATWAGSLIDRVTPDQLAAPTPCSDWTVRDLLGHMVAILGRLRDIGQGADPLRSPSMLAGVPDDEWPARYAAALAGWEEVWGDDAILDKPVRAPFGTMPGGQILGGYIVEYLVHGWDLARATGQGGEAPGDLAARALDIARQIMAADQRGGPLPFAAPVEPSPEAGPTERLANWLGHTA